LSAKPKSTKPPKPIDPNEPRWRRELREEDEREPLEPARGPLAVLIDLADECEGHWRDWDKGEQWLRELDAEWRADLGVGLMGTRPPGLPRPAGEPDDDLPDDEPTSDEWPNPVDLWSLDDGGHLAEKAPKLTREMLPKAIADYAFDVAERMGLEPAMACVPGLNVLAAALPDSLRIQHLVNDDSWTESPRLWSAVIAPPGTTKTPALNAMMAPLHKAEQKLAAKHGRDMVVYRDELRRHKADPINNEEPVLPVEAKLLTNESTIEGLADALKDNPRGMMICADELTGLIGSFDAYRGNGAKKDRAAWLEAWNGGRRVIVARSAAELWCPTGGFPS
jgi:hypothetical protein